MTDDSTDKPTAAACATRVEPEPVAYAPSSQRLIELARRVAASDCTVLIVGGIAFLIFVLFFVKQFFWH